MQQSYTWRTLDATVTHFSRAPDSLKPTLTHSARLRIAPLLAYRVLGESYAPVLIFVSRVLARVPAISPAVLLSE